MQKPLCAALTALALGTAGLTQPAPAQQLSRASPSRTPPPIALRTGPLLGSSITLGVGLARREPYCGGCSQNMGVAGMVNLSRFVNHAMALGMESTVWLNSVGPVSAALGSAMGAVTFWAVEDVPLSISGGLGFVVYHQGNTAYASNTTSAGFGCSGRIGYDARVSSGFALVPYIGYLNTLGRLRVGRADQVVSNLQIGMALRFR
jgi:hypothetical protein